MKVRLMIVVFMCFFGAVVSLTQTGLTQDSPVYDSQSGEQYVTVTLGNGEVYLFVDPTELKKNDLFWVRFELVVHINDAPLSLAGIFMSGHYRNGQLNGKAFVNVDGPLQFQYDEGSLIIEPNDDLYLYTLFRGNQFLWPKLDNLNAIAQLKLENESLTANGVINKGSYRSSEGLTFDARLKVEQDFTYEKALITVSLKSGGFVSVDVQSNAFKKAAFSGIEVNVDLDDPNANTPLKLKATLSNGTYKPGEGITFTARLEVEEDFTYEKAPITATLKSGGFVTADVQNNAFKKATFSGIDANVDVVVPSAESPLKVKGNLANGTYKPGEGVTFEARLEVTEDFVYEKSSIKATLGSGNSINLNIKGNKLKEFGFSNSQVDVVIEIHSGKDIRLQGGIGSGRYKNESIMLIGFVSLIDAFEYEIGGEKITIEPGPVFLRIKEKGKQKAIIETQDATIKIDLSEDDEDNDDNNTMTDS